MRRRVPSCLAWLAAALFTIAPAAAQRADDAEPSPVLAPASLAALGAAAEAECRIRLAARCLAESALTRIAAGQRGAKPIAPNAGSALVIKALSDGGHGAVLRSLLLTAEAVRRIPPQGRPEPGAWDQTTMLRVGLLPELRAAAERIDNPARRTATLLGLARATLDPLTVAASLVAAEAQPPGKGRAVALGWARALTFAIAGDREGLAAWLDALAQGPDFPEEANGDPELGRIAFIGGGGDTIRTDRGAYGGDRNLPRLAAHAWAALGDGPRALAAAAEVRWPPARLWALDTVGRYRSALRPAADARIVALPATHPDARSFRAGLQRAMVRLHMLREVEAMLAEAKEPRESHADLDDAAALPRLLAAAYARAGDAAAAERVAAWTGEARRRLAREESGRDAPTEDELREADGLVTRVRLAAHLARPTGHARARELLDEHAAPEAVEACVAQGRAECRALAFLLQAITEAP